MKIGDYLLNSFLRFFGDLKIFKYPFFILYDPGSYRVKGDEVRIVLNEIKPGDILVRGYKNYLDSYFIPGFFSHVGLYLGKTTEKHDWPEVALKSYKIGDQIVIHSMAEGVFMEDLINFCKCDYLLILRRSKITESDLDFRIANKLVFENALKNLGKPYDFKFDFSKYHTMSCTEFVYNCLEPIMKKYNVSIKSRRAFITKMDMIIPDDFVTSKFDIVFKSDSIQDEKLEKILKSNAT